MAAKPAKTNIKRAKKEIAAKETPTKVIRDRDFAHRINQACDGHPRALPYYHGRLTWIRQQMEERFGENLSLESVRKWFSGESRPRPDKMKKLAELLEVDEGWLSLGLSPEATPSQRVARNAMAAGAVNVVAGVIQIGGGHPAFPADNDPRVETDHVHLYAIREGKQYAMHVALAERIDGQTHKVVIPVGAEKCLCICLVRYDDAKFDMIEIDHAGLAKHGTRKGGYYEAVLKGSDGGYKTGQHWWRKTVSFDRRG